MALSMATEQEQAAVIRALAGKQPVSVIELGAHRGEEYEWLSRGLRIAVYSAVEADPRHVPELRRKLASPFSNGPMVFDAAIADHNGTVILHLCDNKANQAKGSSSIHTPTGHLKHFEWCTFNEKIEVRAMTLDAVAKFTVGPIDLLWVDIQGAEKDMIAGGTETLKRTRFIMIEAESVEMYEGQALKPELLALLPDFEVVEDFGYNVFLKRRSDAI